jgi:hypothetical protein
MKSYTNQKSLFTHKKMKLEAAFNNLKKKHIFAALIDNQQEMWSVKLN